MAKRTFNKDFFIRSVKYNVRTLFRREIEEASEQQIFQAVGYAVKDAIMDAWIATQKEYEKNDPKIVYYMSMEFLMGRALGNNLINLTFYDEVKEALEEIGLDLNLIEDQEPDAALGNGGLGRLAACFLDSLASLGYAAYGCGIRYRIRPPPMDSGTCTKRAVSIVVKTKGAKSACIFPLPYAVPRSNTQSGFRPHFG